jgi:hypothetical protein
LYCAINSDNLEYAGDIITIDPETGETNFVAKTPIGTENIALAFGLCHFLH